MFRYAHSSSRVSKDGGLSTPFASRGFNARSISDYPEGQHRNMAWRKQYYSLSDPHLAHYFRAKMMSELERPKSSRAASSLSKRTPSRGSLSHTPSQKAPPFQSVYKVTLKTGSAENAGTSTRAYVTLQGSKGTLKRRKLTKGGQKELSFIPGKREWFRIRGRDVGQLSHVTVESDGLKKSDSWFLESVTVVNENGEKWFCSCNQWLSLYHTDCQLSRTMKAKLCPSSFIGAETPRTYLLDIHTGDVRGGGTQANVFVTLKGTKKSSSKHHITSEGVQFERGSVIRTEISPRDELGEINNVVISHDNSGFGADWFLDQVVLSASYDPNEKTYFRCGQWLSRVQGDGLIERSLEGSKSRPPTNITYNKLYLVSTVTGAMRGAGTGANVFVTLFGEKGESGERRLDNDPSNFERGRTDTFSIHCPDLGTLNRLIIRHDNVGVAPSWYLDHVEVTSRGGKGTTDEDHVIQFPCGRWLELCDGCGGEIEAELIPGGVATENEEVDHDMRYVYKVTVVTGDTPGSGTNANIHMVLVGGGSGETSGEVRLDNGSRSTQTGQRDLFEVRSPKLVSPVEAVVIGHDNTNTSPGWFLKQVHVECTTTGANRLFPCNQWLCLDSGDGRIERELHPLPHPQKTNHASTLPWEIQILTSDLRGAGTDANVSIQIHGNHGSTSPLPLGDNVANFERGECDIFRDVNIPTSIGSSVEAVSVSHDGSHPYPEWHLEKVVLKSNTTREEYHCHCERWLSSANGNSVRLTAVPVHTPTRSHDMLPTISWGGNTSTPLGNGRGNQEEEEEGEEQDSSITNQYLRQLRYDQVSTSQPSISLQTMRSLSPVSPRKENTIPYTVSILGGAPPMSRPLPHLELVIRGDEGESPPITLEPLGTRSTPGTPEIYSVEGANVGDLTSIRVCLVGTSDTPWLINEITVHSPTSGRTYHFQYGRGLIPGGEECVMMKTETLESSVNASTLIGSPLSVTSDLTAFEVKVSTADKKNAGTTNSLHLLVLGEKQTSRSFVFKNSSMKPKLQRGQTDTFQVALPPLGELRGIKVAHSPRESLRDIDGGGGGREGEGRGQRSMSWYLFQVVLMNVLDRTKYYFLCRKWVDSSASSEELRYTEISLSSTSE